MPRKAALAFAAALAGVAGLLADWVAAFHVTRLAGADRSVLLGFQGLNYGRIAQLGATVPHLSDPKPFVLMGVAIVAVALARGRPRLALAAAAMLIGANVSTQLLKTALASPRFAPQLHVDAAAWPSGHATASMSLALGAILVAPPRWRPPVAAAGAVYSLAVVFTLLVAGWHFPSDVIAGYLMAATWTALAVGAVWAAEARWPTRGPRAAPLRVRDAVAPAAVVAVGGVALAFVVALERPFAVASYARAHSAFVVGAGVIAVLALSLATVLSVALTTTRPARRPTRTEAPGAR